MHNRRTANLLQALVDKSAELNELVFPTTTVFDMRQLINKLDSRINRIAELGQDNLNFYLSIKKQVAFIEHEKKQTHQPSRQKLLPVSPSPSSNIWGFFIRESTRKNQSPENTVFSISELVGEVMSHLPFSEQARLSSVNKCWRANLFHIMANDHPFVFPKELPGLIINSSGLTYPQLLGRLSRTNYYPLENQIEQWVDDYNSQANGICFRLFHYCFMAMLLSTTGLFIFAWLPPAEMKVFCFLFALLSSAIGSIAGYCSQHNTPLAEDIPPNTNYFTHLATMASENLDQQSPSPTINNHRRRTSSISYHH